MNALYTLIPSARCSESAFGRSYTLLPPASSSPPSVIGTLKEACKYMAGRTSANDAEWPDYIVSSAACELEVATPISEIRDVDRHDTIPNAIIRRTTFRP